MRFARRLAVDDAQSLVVAASCLWLHDRFWFRSVSWILTKTQRFLGFYFINADFSQAVYSVASSRQTDAKTLTSVCESFKPDVKLWLFF